MSTFRSIPLYVPLPPAGGTAWVRCPTGDLGGAVTVADVRCFNGAATSSTVSIYVDVLAGTGATTPTVTGTVVATIGGDLPGGAARKIAADGWLGVRVTAQNAGTITQPAWATLLISSGVSGA
jgi:hypothetical protein